MKSLTVSCNICFSSFLVWNNFTDCMCNGLGLNIGNSSKVSNHFTSFYHRKLVQPMINIISGSTDSLPSSAYIVHVHYVHVALVDVHIFLHRKNFQWTIVRVQECCGWLVECTETSGGPVIRVWVRVPVIYDTLSLSKTHRFLLPRSKCILLPLWG